MNVTLKQIQALLLVAECGSFTKAAAEMHLSQSAISVLVSELEKQLKVKLLDRTTRRVVLTEAGRQFHKHVAKVVTDIDAAIKEARAVHQRNQAKVSIAAAPILAATLLPSVIQEFTARNPHVEITLIDARHSQFMSMIRAGEIDFALGTFFVEPQELNAAELQSREIAKCHLHVFCPTGHPLLDLPEVSWRLIRDWPVIALTQDSGVRALAEQAMQSADIALEPAYEVSHSFTALAMVEKNLGVALLPSYTAALGRFPEIGSRLLVDPAVSHEIHLIRRKGQVRSKETDMLEDLIVRKINSQLVGFNEDGS